MSNFLFKEVSEKEKEEIRKQAKKIMDDFSDKLASVKLEGLDVGIEREVCEREENFGKCDENFSREIMFENAPCKNDDFIIAEKGGWEE